MTRQLPDGIKLAIDVTGRYARAIDEMENLPDADPELIADMEWNLRAIQAGLTIAMAPDDDDLVDAALRSILSDQDAEREAYENASLWEL